MFKNRMVRKNCFLDFKTLLPAEKTPIGESLPCWTKHQSSHLLCFNFILSNNIGWVYPPPRISVTNEGLGWDFLLKMVHNPGGDWHPGWGVVPKYRTPMESSSKLLDLVLWNLAWILWQNAIFFFFKDRTEVGFIEFHGPKHKTKPKTI